MDKYILDITQSLTVLYVEDDENLLNSTSKLLLELFKHVDTAKDGEEGLSMYNNFYLRSNKYYDLVVTDIQMPNLNGVQMTEKIYNINPDQSVIVLSAYNDSEYLEKFIDLGVDGFIKKPIKFNEFLKKIIKVSLSIDAHNQNELYLIKMDQLNQELEEKVALRTRELEILVYTDSLTGYGNRYKLNKKIQTSMNPALAIINIDNFSQINDFYGHERGDEVIKNIGNVIWDILRRDKRFELYHLQGDEFVIFCGDIMQDEFLNMIRNVILAVNHTTVKINEEELYIQVSTAISFEKKEKILISANMAKKVLKRENLSYVIYDDTISLDEEYKHNLKWVKKIKKGLGEDRFVPAFQAIVNNHTNSFEKYECLVRLQDHEKLFPPSYFLNISKQTKQYIEITKVMLKKSFEAFKDNTLEFSLNLTIEDILNLEITNFIVELLQNYNIGSRVVFEIVESESIENFERVASFIEDVKSFGCKVAIDDFGTGYSNFEYLIKLKADYIKIDGSLIKHIDTNKDMEQVVVTIVEFARKMGMKTIAEFVESESIFEKVKELGIDYSQGYYLGKPDISNQSILKER